MPEARCPNCGNHSQGWALTNPEHQTCPRCGTKLEVYKEDTMATAYCFKCSKKVEIKNPKQITLKNNRFAVEGVCSVCGTKVFRIGKLQMADEQPNQTHQAPKFC